MLTKLQVSKTTTPVCYLFAGCCIIITGTGILWPDSQTFLGAFTSPVQWPQLFTVGFQHGFDAVSALLHLSFNLFVWWHIGRFTEKLLGSVITTIIMLTAMLTYAWVHHQFQMVGHGSSGIIWAYSPIILFALIESRRINNETKTDPYYRTLRQTLFVIWVLVTLFMAGVPMSISSNDMPIEQALFYGNLFHISATLTGFALAVLLKKRIAQNLKRIQTENALFTKQQQTKGLFIAGAIPVFLVVWLMMNL